MPRLFQRLFKKQSKGNLEAPAVESAPTEPLPTKAFPSGIKLLHDSGKSVVDLIFIHGLTGDRERSWTAKNASNSWPQTLLPSKIPNARVLTFGYDAYVTNWRGMVSKNRIGNHSMNLLTSIATFREDDDTNERPIIFVCHSLGGLVCEDALLAAAQRPEPHLQTILNCTRGILFLGTPHHGSGLAQWAETLAKAFGLIKQTNAEIISVLQSDSEVLARIQDGFHAMIRSRNQGQHRPIDITCFYEELPLPGIGVVVPSHSAILPGYIPIGIRDNHMDMIRFDSVEDQGFIAISGELRRWVRNLGVSNTVVVPVQVVHQEERPPPAPLLTELSDTHVPVAQVEDRATPPVPPGPQQTAPPHRPTAPAENEAARPTDPGPPPVPSSLQRVASSPQPAVTSSLQQPSVSSPQALPDHTPAPETSPPPPFLQPSQTQTGPSQSSTTLGSAPPVQATPPTPQTPASAPAGINVAGTGGDVNISNASNSFSGNIYGGVHVAQLSDPNHPFAAYLPKANMGPAERALMKASSKADLEQMRKLIANGAHIDAIDGEGHSAITMAISREELDAVKLLIENGASMERDGYLVHKPLHVAVGTGNAELVEMILDGGADVDETTGHGTALKVALGGDHDGVVRLLLSRDADPNIIGQQIHPPLWWVVMQRKERFVPLLLKYGGKSEGLKGHNETILKLLSLPCRNIVNDWQTQPYSEHVKTIRRASSDKSRREAALHSALSCARDNGHREVHALFMELAAEFGMSVDRQYEFVHRLNR